MRITVKKTLVISIFFAVAALFMLYNTGPNLDYVIPKRAIRLATMVVVAFSIGYSAIIFQTITANRILTPSIMGYEAIFILFQTVLVFIYGDKTFQMVGNGANFFLSIALMMGYSLLMYFFLFKKGKKNIYFLLLIGLVLGTFLSTLSQFFQIIIDPNEFTVVEGFLFVSFNKMNTPLLTYASILLIGTAIFGYRYYKYLDVIALGRDHAISLGLNYNQLIQVYLLMISVLVSVSTALVGPITFIGILVTNLTYELFKTSKHKTLIPMCCLIAATFIIAAQILVEHLFNLSTTVSIIINFIGGIYFMYLVLKSTKKL